MSSKPGLPSAIDHSISGRPRAPRDLGYGLRVDSSPSRRGYTRRTTPVPASEEHIPPRKRVRSPFDLAKAPGLENQVQHVTPERLSRRTSNSCQHFPPLVPQQAEPIRKRAILGFDGLEGASLPTPPRTPEIPRLRTPDLEPLDSKGRFCDCCQDDDDYLCGRAKMDAQRKFILLCFVLLVSSWFSEVWSPIGGTK